MRGARAGHEARLVECAVGKLDVNEGASEGRDVRSSGLAAAVRQGDDIVLDGGGRTRRIVGTRTCSSGERSWPVRRPSTV